MRRKEIGTIGRGVVVRGLVSATGDLTIEGQVEGQIALADNVLTIGRSGRVEAQVLAKEVNVMGTVDGNINATDTINVLETAIVDGALGAPRVGIEEGASFRGHIDIRIPPPKNHQAAQAATTVHAAAPATGRARAAGEESQRGSWPAVWRGPEGRPGHHAVARRRAVEPRPSQLAGSRRAPGGSSPATRRCDASAP